MNIRIIGFLLVICFVPQSTTDQTNCSNNLVFVLRLLVDSNKASHIQQLNSSNSLNCTEITLVSSSFSIVSGEMIKKFQNLEKITGSNSGIETISFSFNKPVELKALILDHNKIASLNDSTFVNVPKLETLDLSHNKVSSIQQNVFSHLKKLIILKLSHNQLVFFKLDWFRNEVFKELELQNNRMAEITSIADCTVRQAVVVKLGHNNLTDISGMKCFHRIDHLRLSNNRALTLNATQFESFASTLTTLYLNDVGQLENFNGILASMPNLKMLAIGNIDFEKTRNFTSLSTLHIRRDRKQEIDYKHLKNVFSNLNHVDLRNNDWDCKYRTGFVLHLKSECVNITYEHSKIIGTGEEVIRQIGCTGSAMLISAVKVMWVVITIFTMILIMGFVLSCKYHLAMKAQKNIHCELRKAEFKRYCSIQYVDRDTFLMDF